MTYLFHVRVISLVIASSLSFLSTGIAIAGENTMPSSYKDEVSPELAKEYSYIEDGVYSKALNIPTYEWMPVDQPPKTIVLGIHGLTLHGRRFRVLARTLAVNGIGFISLDMRGYGRCRFDETKQFSSKSDNKSAVNNEKSYEDIVKLAQMIKTNNPNQSLIALGESLGCTFCVRLAAEHPELTNEIILSAPAVHLNPDMYGGHGQVKQGLKAVFKPQQQVNLRSFFTRLCSQNEEIRNEMMDDPLLRKDLSLGVLLSSDEVVSKTAYWGKKTGPHLAVLILQGSNDGCVSPKRVTDLMNNMPSDDQTLAWHGNFGHLQLETSFVRAATIDAIANWLFNHSNDNRIKLKSLKEELAGLGGTVLE